MDREARVGVCLGCSGDDLIVYAVRPSARYIPDCPRFMEVNNTLHVRVSRIRGRWA